MNEDYKNSEIILCSNVHIDKNYDNVLDISKADLVGYLRTHSEYVGNDYSIIPQYRNSLIVNCPYATALKCNYMTFRNPDYENEFVFAFINNVDYISEESTQINFTLDVWHTHHDKFNINKVFVEREHVNNDTPGLHTIPEGLEHGEYIIDEAIKKSGYEYSNCSFILATTIFPYVTYNSTDQHWELAGGRGAHCNVYNSILSGVEYFWYSNTQNGIEQLQHVIEAFDYAGQSDYIYMLFVAPNNSFEKVLEEENVGYWGSVKQKQGSYYDLWTSNNTPGITKPTTLDSYTPKNKKLLTYPYCCLVANNGNGGNGIFHYELFKDDDAPNDCEFIIESAICPGVSTILRPIYYKSNTNAYNQLDGVPGGKYPMCSWNSDAYINWLTQNSVNIKFQLAEDVLNITSSAINEGSGIIRSSMHLIKDIMSIKQQQNILSNQAKGNLNSGDVNFSNNETTFTMYKMSIKRENAVVIDEFFSRFGYQINEVKQPTLHNRTQFDYIKVGGTDNLISGKIPAMDLEEINNICRRGTTIFHNITNFGNYTIDNPIVS